MRDWSLFIKQPSEDVEYRCSLHPLSVCAALGNQDRPTRVLGGVLGPLWNELGLSCLVPPADLDQLVLLLCPLPVRPREEREEHCSERTKLPGLSNSVIGRGNGVGRTRQTALPSSVYSVPAGSPGWTGESTGACPLNPPPVEETDKTWWR